jgi:deferrochelatase/peroxidase EfeB
MLDVADIQGDIVVGLQKSVQNFIFFKIVDKISFKLLVKLHITGRITIAELAQHRELVIERRQKLGQKTYERFEGLNLGFTKDGLTLLFGAGRPELDPAFERGAGHSDTTTYLNDPPFSSWVRKFASDRIDGVFLVTGPERLLVSHHSNQLLSFLGASIKVVYSEIGNVRPKGERGHEHFGFLDGISQPGIRGLTPVSDPILRRSEGRVRERATALGMSPKLLAARMVGRWKSGAPLESAPLHDNPVLGADDRRNNDFEFGGDPFQRKCRVARRILTSGRSQIRT